MVDDEIELLLNVSVDWESVRSKYEDILRLIQGALHNSPDCSKQLATHGVL